MPDVHLNLLLADDDLDDCIFFKEALEELPLDYSLTMVHNGAGLMQRLSGDTATPDILYLDLNMPLKTGYECLEEIRNSKRLKNLPVIIISTSYDHMVANELYKKGAHFYIRKPGDFAILKKIIYDSILLVIQHGKKSQAKMISCSIKPSTIYICDISYNN